MVGECGYIFFKTDQTKLQILLFQNKTLRISTKEKNDGTIVRMGIYLIKQAAIDK